MKDVREAWIEGAQRLSSAGIESARLDARVLFAYAMGAENASVLLTRAPTPDEIARYGELIDRRIAREPIAYITGEREFWSLNFEVGPGALIPRPETETLLDEARRHFPNAQDALDVLDLGTGSGCLLIAFLRTYPRAQGTGVERSSEALRWARRNAERLGVADRCRWHEADWSTVEGAFDVILANPPYLAESEAANLAPEVSGHEPPGALFAGPDGLEAYRSLAPIIARALKPGGHAFVEIGAGQADRVQAIVRGQGLEIGAVIPDLLGIPRCIVADRVGTPSRAGAEKTVGNRAFSR